MLRTRGVPSPPPDKVGRPVTTIRPAQSLVSSDSDASVQISQRHRLVINHSGLAMSVTCSFESISFGDFRNVQLGTCDVVDMLACVVIAVLASLGPIVLAANVDDAERDVTITAPGLAAQRPQCLPKGLASRFSRAIRRVSHKVRPQVLTPHRLGHSNWDAVRLRVPLRSQEGL